MSVGHQARCSGDASVMTDPALCPAAAVVEPRAGYGIISRSAARLTVFRSAKPFSSFHDALQSPRRDAWVMTRRTPAACEAEVTSSHIGANHSFASNHCGGVGGRPHAHPAGTFGNRFAETRTPAGDRAS